MIIDFRNMNGGSGSGGTTNYNELENKPQINGVTLSGNVSSDQLGITLNELQPVSGTPSAATNGTVYATSNTQHVVNYEWSTGTGKTFILTVNKNPITNTKVASFYDEAYGQSVDLIFREDWGGFGFIGYDDQFFASVGDVKSDYLDGDSSDGWGATIDYTNSGSCVVSFWYVDGGDPGDADETSMTYARNEVYDVVENSVKQAYIDASGNTQYDTFLKSGSSYNLLSDKPSINGVQLVGNVTSNDLGIEEAQTSTELKAVSVLPTVAREGSVFAYSQPETVFGWENIGYDADNKFKAEFVMKQMPDVSDMPITLGTANVTGSLDETISQDLVLINDFFDGIMVQVGDENYMRKGQSSSFWYHGDNDLLCEYDWTNEALLKFTIYENGTSQTKSGATITNQVDSEYVSINSLVQADGVNASGETIYKKVGADGMHIHWYAYSDGHFMYAREKCTNNGDYLVHQGAEIEGSRTYAGVRISGGTIVEAPYSGVDNIGDGHWAGSKEDANGVSYFFHCWVEGSYLYWQTSSPIMTLDAYGTGSDYQGGLMYGGETGTDSSISQIRFTNLDLAAMSIGDTTQVVVAMPDMEFGKQYLRASTGATSGVSFGASIDDFANVVTIPSYVFTLTKVTGNTLGWDMFTLTPSDTVNFTKLSWYCYDSNTPYPLSLVSNFNNYTLTFQNGKVKLIGSWVNSDQSTSFSRQFASYIESQQQLKYNPYKNGDIEFIIYKVPTA